MQGKTDSRQVEGRRKTYAKPQFKAFGTINKVTAGGIPFLVADEPTLYYYSEIV